MLGMENALMGMIENPKLIHALMEKGTELCIVQSKLMMDNGIRVLRINDSAANMTVISPQMWKEYIKPYFTAFCSAAHAYCKDALIYCHICGDIRPIVKDMIETGLDCIAPLDPLAGVTVGEIRRMIGDDYMLMGGVNTLSFINKTPDEIMEEAEACIKAGFVNNGHFAIGSGCVVPRAAKEDTLKALAKASRNLAVY
jgi:uroporphyrinogen-III decarboxylase